MMPADIKKYLNGKLPQMNNLIKLAKFFNCSVDYLIGIADDE